MQPLIGAKAAAAGYRYFKFHITANNGAGSLTMLANLDIFVGGTDWPLSTMTDYAAPTPYVISTNNEYSSSYKAWQAFRNIIGGSNSWRISGSDGYIIVDMGSAIVPTSIGVCSLIAGGAGIFALKNFTFKGSATGVFAGEDTLLVTGTNQTGWTPGEVRTFTI
jgi:hypothetical protein